MQNETGSYRTSIGFAASKVRDPACAIANAARQRLLSIHYVRHTYPEEP